MMASQQNDSVVPSLTIAPIATTMTTDDLLGDRAQAIIAVNQKLKQLGIDQTISLPQICVIGDQSAGKSSLIEAISNIEVPKADGTCTRCPVAINLASGPHADSPWTCKVSIEERYDYVPGHKVTEKNPLGPWQKRVDMKLVELETTHDKSRVAHLITEAQNKVLDRSLDSTTPLRRNVTRQNASSFVKFSPNVIRLDICEGIRANLCFIDLPGVIVSMAHTEDRYLISLVQNLVKQYANDPRNENILALPMPIDVQNSKASSIIQELGVEDRTLPVFTKPDRADKELQQRCVDQYLIKSTLAGGIANDETTRFKSGCHIVMLAKGTSGKSRSIDDETDYFQQSIWKDLQPHYGHHLGIPALCTYLRNQLYHKTREALPQNLQAIQAELGKIEQDLKDLPPPPDKAFFRYEMRRILVVLAEATQSKFLGDGENSIKGKLKTKFEEFASDISDAGPAVDHATRTEIRQLASATAQVEELLKDKKSVKAQDPCDDGIAEETSGKHFRLLQLQKINKAFDNSGLPGGTHPKAINKACEESVECWDTKLTQFLDDIHIFLKAHVMDTFREVFKQYETLGVYIMVEEWINRYLETAMNTERGIVGEISRVERSTPFTLDSTKLEELNIEKERVLLQSRLEFRVTLAKKEKDVEEGIYKKDRKDINQDTIGRDDHKAELILGARAQAYYEIASKRFIDTVCQGLYSRRLRVCGKELAADLKNDIGPEDPKNEDQIAAWMVEEPEKEKLRTGLTRKHEQLLQGRRYIESVLGSATNPIVSPTKRSSSPDQITSSVSEKVAKKQKLTHRTSSIEPITPQSQSIRDVAAVDLKT